MKVIKSVKGIKYVVVEVNKIPEVGSTSWHHYLNCDYPTGISRVDKLTADDGSTIYLANYVLISTNESVGKVAFMKKGSYV